MPIDQLDSQPRSTALLAVTVLLLIWSTLFTAVRTWAKWEQKKFSWFDAVFATGYVSAIGQCIAIILATTLYGFGQGRDAPFNYESLMKAFYASNLLYIFSVGLTKCSTSLFLGSLSRDNRQKISGFGLTAVSAAWTIGSILAVAVRGSATPWLTGGSLFVRWVGVEASGLVVEAMLWIFSITLVWGLNMELSRRLKLIAIFGSRLVIIPLVALRLARLQPSVYSSSSTHDVSMVYIYTEAVMHFALIAECLTCMKPLMQTFHEGLAPGDSNGQHYWGSLDQTKVTSPRSNLSGSGDKSAKKGVQVFQREVPSWRSSSIRDRLDLRSDHSGFSTRVESKRYDRGTRAEDDDMELLPVDNTNSVIHG